MRTPLCRVCQLTGVLCPSCEDKYRAGEITKLDIDVSVALSRLTKNVKELEDVELKKVLRVGNEVVLLVGERGRRKLLTHAKGAISKLEKELGARVRVIEDKPSLREFVEGVFRPVPVATVNRILLPDGSEEVRVVLARRARREDVEIASRILEAAKGLEVRVEVLR